jgi:hypothetical protein
VQSLRISGQKPSGCTCQGERIGSATTAAIRPVERRARAEDKRVELLLQRGDQPRMCMAEVMHGVAMQIEIPPAIGIDEPGP